MKKYGAAYTAISGWVAEPGCEQVRHRFGGSSWPIIGVREGSNSPTLLLTLDLSDPRLAGLGVNGLDELPLCSYLNCDAWTGKQVYQVDPPSRRLILCHQDSGPSFHLPPDLVFPNPLPESPLRLRAMVPSEIPADEESYWKACDSFLGGSAVIRVGGPVLWLQDPAVPKCDCHADLEYVAAIGYEDFRLPGKYVTDRPFFIGEAALYFFLCKSCLKAIVTSQPS